MVQAQKRVKECHTSFDISKALIQTGFFSKYDLSSSEGLILLSITSHWNHNTEISYPTIRRIAAETNLSKVTIIKGIEGLRKKKILLTAKYKGRLNYRFTNVFFDLLSGSEDSTVEVKTENQEGIKSVTEGKLPLPYYIKTNKRTKIL